MAVWVARLMRCVVADVGRVAAVVQLVTKQGDYLYGASFARTASCHVPDSRAWQLRATPASGARPRATNRRHDVAHKTY